MAWELNLSSRFLENRFSTSPFLTKWLFFSSIYNNQHLVLCILVLLKFLVLKFHTFIFSPSTSIPSPMERIILILMYIYNKIFMRLDDWHILILV